MEYVSCEIHVYDKSFNLLRVTLDAPNYCGLAYNENHGEFIVINSGRDTISIHEGTDFSLQRIHYLGGESNGALSEHHLNDVTTSGNYIYVSFFSHSGNWKKVFLMVG